MDKKGGLVARSLAFVRLVGENIAREFLPPGKMDVGWHGESFDGRAADTCIWELGPAIHTVYLREFGVG